MRDFWNDGSCARDMRELKRRDTYYYPSSKQCRFDVEYIHPPIKPAKQRHVLKTRTYHYLCLGILQASRWSAIAIGGMVTILMLIAFGIALFSSMPNAIKAPLLFRCGCTSAVVCTIDLLIYTYYYILVRKQNRVEGLRKRTSIIYEFKIACYIFVCTLFPAYFFIIPQIASIVILFMST